MCKFGSIILYSSHGPVAQLGAHYIRIVGVGSSNLLGSTKKYRCLVKVPVFLYVQKEIRTIQCSSPVDCCQPPAGRRLHYDLLPTGKQMQRISSGPPKNRRLAEASVFYRLKSKFEGFHAEVRWNTAWCRSMAATTFSYICIAADIPRCTSQQLLLSNQPPEEK